MRSTRAKALALSGALIFALNGASPGTARASSDVGNPLFGYTHLLPSPFTLPSGTLVLGTQVALGITDFLEVGTDVIRDFYKFYNASGKLALLDFEQFALGATVGFEHYNYQDIDSRNPDLSVTSWLPGLTAGYAPIRTLAIFAGGNMNFTNTTLTTQNIETSGYLQGARLQSEVSWAYNPKKKSIGNVLSGGVSYDLNYKIFGFGASHHWGGFQLGIHYYPNADKNKILPILAGGATVPL